jgi:hypothetical protein
MPGSKLDDGFTLLVRFYRNQVDCFLVIFNWVKDGDCTEASGVRDLLRNEGE